LDRVGIVGDHDVRGTPKERLDERSARLIQGQDRCVVDPAVKSRDDDDVAPVGSRRDERHQPSRAKEGSDLGRGI
jgi:hypothetical protein